MHELFSIPSSDHAIELSVLNRFLVWVKESHLPIKIQNDTIKIIESLRWVKVNIEKIRWFVDNKERCIDDLTERDKRRGVVRDHLNGYSRYLMSASPNNPA